MKTSAAVSIVLLLVVLSLPSGGGQQTSKSGLRLLLLIVSEYCTRITPTLRPAFCYQILAGNITSAQLLKAFVQYKGTVSTAAQQMDLQSARRT